MLLEILNSFVKSQLCSDIESNFFTIYLHVLGVSQLDSSSDMWKYMVRSLSRGLQFTLALIPKNGQLDRLKSVCIADPRWYIFVSLV